MAIIDLYPGSPAQCPGIDGPIIHAQVPPGDDVTDLTYVSRGILVTVAGNVKVTLRGDVRAGSNVPAVTVVLPLVVGWNPVRATRIWNTSTTATGLVAVT